MDPKAVKYHSRILKNILKDPRNIDLLEGFGKHLNLEFSISSVDSGTLWGEDKPSDFSIELRENDVLFAYVNANQEQGQLIADLLMALVRKDLEKKKIGNEVLGLYREINMIYDFSERLSETIEVASIAEMALTEASQIIDSSHGLFLIYEPEIDKVVLLSSFGEDGDRDKNIVNQNQVLKELIKRGTSSIVEYERIKGNPALRHLESMMYAPLKVKNNTLGMVILGHNKVKEFTAAELKLLTTIALQSAVAIESAQLYQKGLRAAKEREEAITAIHKVSQKFVPNEFIKSLGKDKITEVSLGDLVEKEVTVMFVDIRDFTTMSENLNPKDNFLFINAFNKRMGPIIRKNEGFIMQYLGDGFMALFPNGAQNALRAAVEMNIELELLNQQRIEQDKAPVKIGIGMQNGDLIMGITGDIERLDAAIISDTVNTASRIEGLSKHFGTNILVSENCIENLTDPEEFNFRFLGPVRVKGKQKPIRLYECINGDEQVLQQHKLTTLGTFDEGMRLYFNKEFAMAAVTFQQIIKQNSDDHTARLLLNRSAHLITKEIGDDWKGVESMTNK
jgi:class 3 adenylate cyclase